MSEEVAAECRADGHAANAIEVVEAHGGGHEAIVGAHECHDDITAEHIDLGECHILVFVLCGGDEIKHGRRSLHVEEATHQSAEHAGADLCGQGRPQPYLLIEKTKASLTNSIRYSYCSSIGIVLFFLNSQTVFNI